MFGFYTSVPWESIGTSKNIPGQRAFLFKAIEYGEIVKFEQKDNRAEVYHTSSQMFSTANSIIIHDKANEVDNDGGFSKAKFDIPDGLNIDENTYLGGTQYFKIKEIEVYQVIL